MKLALYRALPEPLKKAIRFGSGLLPPSFRFGPVYHATRRHLAAEAGLTPAAVRARQFAQLQAVVTRAYSDVPGYHQLYQEAGVSPADLRAPADLARFPFVTKKLLSENLAEFTSRRVPQWKRLYRTTAGSTGIPFGFYLTPDAIEREYAFIHNAWARAGWKAGDRSAVLRGAYVGSKRRFWEYDHPLNNLQLSTYLLSERTLRAYLDKLREYRVRHLQAYPSAAMILADLIADAGERPPDLRLLLLGSENLYGWQRDKLARVFPGARIFSWYGHAEQVIFAPECEKSTALHLDPYYGLTELLGADGRPVGEGEVGELVGTSFWNEATPFIRYRTMDLAERGPVRCAACGREQQLLNRVQGRLQELVVTSDGRYISMTAINMHSDVFDAVRQFQFRQRERGLLLFQVVPKPGYNEQVAAQIRAELQKKLGSEMSLTLEVVPAIEPTRSGKLRFLVQELPIRYGDHE